MPYDFPASGDIGQRAITLEDHVAQGQHDSFFREMVSYAREFAHDEDRIEAMTVSGNFRELDREKRKYTAEVFIIRRTDLVTQGLELVLRIAENPREAE